MPVFAAISFVAMSEALGVGNLVAAQQTDVIQRALAAQDFVDGGRTQIDVKTVPNEITRQIELVEKPTAAIDPAVTPSIEAVTPTVFFATIGTTPGLTSTRLRTVFKTLLAEGDVTGSVPVAGGLMLQSSSGVSAG
jgi:hypothetical protein